MSKVSWYKQRLKALLFKARFADKVEEIKPVRNKLSFLVFRCLGLEIKSVVREPQASNKPLVKSVFALAVVCFLIGVECWKSTWLSKMIWDLVHFKSGKETLWLSLGHHFQKVLFTIFFLSTLKRKAVSKSSCLKRLSKSAVFLTYSSTDGRPNCRKKAVFSTSSGVIVLSRLET